jgi:hypothetical protein
MAGIIQIDDQREWCVDSWLWELVVGCLRELVDEPGVRKKIDEARDTGIYWFSLQEISPAEAVLVRGAILTQLRAKAYVNLPQDPVARNQVLVNVENLIRSAGPAD